MDRFSRKSLLARYNLELERNVLQFQPDLVVVTKGVNIFPETLRGIKEGLPRARLVNINYDDFFSRSPSNVFPRIGEVASLYDIFFPSKKANLEELRGLGSAEVYYLPIGYDPCVHYPVMPDPDEYRSYFSEVSFVGTFTEERARTLQALSEYRLGIWGGHWRRRKVSPFLRRSIARSGKNRNVGGLTLAKVIASSRISLNFFRKENRDTHNHRTFELPACGGFMLSQRSEELGELFAEGKEFVGFDSAEEMADKIQYYLKHDESREKIARAGYQRLKREKYTIRDRVKTMLEIIETGGR